MAKGDGRAQFAEMPIDRILRNRSDSHGDHGDGGRADLPVRLRQRPCLHLGVPVWAAPLVAPAIDLSIRGLLLAIAGTQRSHTRPTAASSSASGLRQHGDLGINLAHPIVVGEYGEAPSMPIGQIQNRSITTSVAFDAGKSPGAGREPPRSSRARTRRRGAERQELSGRGRSSTPTGV